MKTRISCSKFKSFENSLEEFLRKELSKWYVGWASNEEARLERILEEDASQFSFMWWPSTTQSGDSYTLMESPVYGDGDILVTYDGQFSEFQRQQLLPGFLKEKMRVWAIVGPYGNFNEYNSDGHPPLELYTLTKNWWEDKFRVLGGDPCLYGWENAAEVAFEVLQPEVPALW